MPSPLPPALASLVGPVGQDQVQSLLSQRDPRAAVAEIRQRAALQHPEAPALLSLLRLLGVSSLTAHRAALAGALAELRRLAERAGPDALLRLLEQSFPFVALPALREVPLLALSRLQTVPASFLRQLAADAALFASLPLQVKRQVWELDRKLLLSHASPLFAGAALERGARLWALDVGRFYRPGAGGEEGGEGESESGGGCQGESRGASAACGNNAQVEASGSSFSSSFSLPTTPARRPRDSVFLRRLCLMSQGSRRVCQGLQELLAAWLHLEPRGRTADALCALRSQLPMAQHERRDAEACAADACHRLAWALDAGLHGRGGGMQARHVRQAREVLEGLEEGEGWGGWGGEWEGEEDARGVEERREHKRGKRDEDKRREEEKEIGNKRLRTSIEPLGRLSDQPKTLSAPSTLSRPPSRQPLAAPEPSSCSAGLDAESAGAPGAALVPAGWRASLLAAAAILRDPPALHALLAALLRAVERRAGEWAALGESERVRALNAEPEVLCLAQLVRLAAGAPARAAGAACGRWDAPLQVGLCRVLARAALGEGDGTPLVRELVGDPAACLVVQAAALRALARDDGAAARWALAELAAALERSAAGTRGGGECVEPHAPRDDAVWPDAARWAAHLDAAHAPWASFAFALARGLGRAQEAGCGVEQTRPVAPDPLLVLGLERLLVPLAAAEPLVHEEVVRLLLRRGAELGRPAAERLARRCLALWAEVRRLPSAPGGLAAAVRRRAQAGERGGEDAPLAALYAQLGVALGADLSLG